MIYKGVDACERSSCQVRPASSALLLVALGEVSDARGYEDEKEREERREGSVQATVGQKITEQMTSCPDVRASVGHSNKADCTTFVSTSMLAGGVWMGEEGWVVKAACWLFGKATAIPCIHQLATVHHNILRICLAGPERELSALR